MQSSTEEIGGLQPRSNFRLTFHEMVMDAPELFGPCAMQTLYIHESADFKDINQARAAAFQPAKKGKLKCPFEPMPGMQHDDSCSLLLQLLQVLVRPGPLMWTCIWNDHW